MNTLILNIIMVGILIMLLVDNVIFYQFKKVVNLLISIIEQMQDEIEELKIGREVQKYEQTSKKVKR